MIVKTVSSFYLSMLFFSIGYAQPEPLFVMFERDPMYGTFREEGPQFILYTDGTVIYWQSHETGSKKEVGYQYYTIKLSGNEFMKFKALFINIDLINKLKKEYALKHFVLSESEAIITQEFAWFVNGKTLKSCYIYGQIEKDFNPKFKELSFLYEIARTIRSFKPQKKQLWIPEKVEVLFSPFNQAFEQSIEWPSKWPDLKDSSSVDRTRIPKKPFSPGKTECARQIDLSIEIGEETFPYSVFVPGKDYFELMSFLKTRKDNGAVLIDGKKMYPMTICPFPCEKMWKFVSRENPIFESKAIEYKSPYSGRNEEIDDLTR